jgi:hypothetical protein
MSHACASLTKLRGGGPICNGGNEAVEAAGLLVQTTLYHPASSADTNLLFGFFQPIQPKESKIAPSVPDAAISLA